MIRNLSHGKRMYPALNPYQHRIRKQDARIVIPANVRRYSVHTPCLKCGAARDCEHRSVAA